MEREGGVGSGTIRRWLPTTFWLTKHRRCRRRPGRKNWRKKWWWSLPGSLESRSKRHEKLLDFYIKYTKKSCFEFSVPGIVEWSDLNPIVQQKCLWLHVTVTAVLSGVEIWVKCVMNSIQTLIGIQEKGKLKKGKNERKKDREEEEKKLFFSDHLTTSEQTTPSSDKCTQGPVVRMGELNYANQKNSPFLGKKN